MLKRLKKNILFYIGTTIGLHPQLYWIRYRRGLMNGRLVHPYTDICLEGFQRSGNSFLYSVFLHWNRQDNPRVANHVHAPMQIIKAVEYKVPVALLIREPLETISSLLVMDENLGINHAVKAYVKFYKKLKPYKDKIVVAPFQTTINHPDQIFENLNKKFNTDFKTVVFKKENFKHMYVGLGNLKTDPSQSPVPNEMKEARKKLYREKIKNSKHFDEALALFDYFVAS